MERMERAVVRTLSLDDMHTLAHDTLEQLPQVTRDEVPPVDRDTGQRVHPLNWMVLCPVHW